jgi:hypothetical protein
MWRCLERGPQSACSPAGSTHEAYSGGSSRIPSRWARQALRVVPSQMVMMSGRWVFKVDISQLFGPWTVLFDPTLKRIAD